MRTTTWLWIAWGLAFVALEGWAFYKSSYADTLTGHLRNVMLAHPVAMVAIPTVVVGVAVHLLIEALRAAP